MRQSSKDRSAKRAHTKVMYTQLDLHEEDVAHIEALAHALTVNDETSDHLRAKIESILDGDRLGMPMELH
jgi:hypothetical protein